MPLAPRRPARGAVFGAALTTLLLAAGLWLAGAAGARAAQPFVVQAGPAQPVASLEAARQAAVRQALAQAQKRLGGANWSAACRDQAVQRRGDYLSEVGKRYTRPNAQGRYQPVYYFRVDPDALRRVVESCSARDLPDIRLAVALTVCWKEAGERCRKTAATDQLQGVLNRRVEAVLRQAGFDLPQLPEQFARRLAVARDLDDVWGIVEGNVSYALIGQAAIDAGQARARDTAAGQQLPVTLNAKFLNLNASTGGTVPVEGTDIGTGTSREAAAAAGLRHLADTVVRNNAVHRVSAAWKEMAQAGLPVDVVFMMPNSPELARRVKAALPGIATDRGCEGDPAPGVRCLRLKGEDAFTSPIAALEKAGAPVCRISRNRKRFYLFNDDPGRWCAGRMQTIGRGDVVLSYCAGAAADGGPAPWQAGVEAALDAYPDIAACDPPRTDLGAGEGCRRVLGLDDGKDPLAVIRRALTAGRERGHFAADLQVAHAARSRPGALRMVVGARMGCFR
jgi:hypothetical protein